MILYVSNTNGRILAPHINLLRIKAASGIKVSCATADTDYTQTVVPGAIYRVVGGPDTGTDLVDIWFSITGVITTEANRELTLPQHTAGIIEIPVGITTLHIGASADDTDVYLSQVDT